MSARTVARSVATLDEYEMLGTEPADGEATPVAPSGRAGRRSATAPDERKVRRPVRQEQAPNRPELQVVARRRRVGVRAATVVGAILTTLCLFAVVSLNALLAENQYQLERLEEARDRLARENEQKRLVDAQLRAPGRIVDAASALGLVHARAAMAVTLRGGVGGDPSDVGQADGSIGGERTGASRAAP